MRADRQQHCLSLEGIGDIPEPAPEPLPDIDPEQLQQALNELPEAFRTPIILYYFEDFGYRDIAEQMDLPLGTVMSRLARAKAHLRNRLLQPGPAPPRPVEGVGDEAFWTGGAVGGALYVLKGDTYLRISIGGPDDQAARIERAKVLARKAIARL